MNVLFRLCLTLSATFLLVIVFLVQNGYGISHFIPSLLWIDEKGNYTSYIIYSIIPVVLTWLCIVASRSWLAKAQFKKGHIVSIEHANNSFLPSYLGYFFVALSVSNYSVLGFVYSVLFVFTFFSQALYFNPMFLIFKFDFYTVTTKNGASIFLISKGKYKIPSNIEINDAYRINDYTYIVKD